MRLTIALPHTMPVCCQEIWASTKHHATLSRRAIRAAKRRYSERIESHFQLNDSRRMWQGLKTICSSGNKSSAEVRADPLLAEELNNLLYGRFELQWRRDSAEQRVKKQQTEQRCLVLSPFQRTTFGGELKRVNVRKAAGPDGITGRVLRSCADQLAGLFTSIFNESLATSVVPTLFKKSVIIPVPKNSKPSCLNDYRPVALTSRRSWRFLRDFKETHLLLHPCYFGPSSVCLSAK